MLPTILEAVDKPSPIGKMFADGIRVDWLRALARHHLRIEASIAGPDLIQIQ